jgi:hypothetical protein
MVTMGKCLGQSSSLTHVRIAIAYFSTCVFSGFDRQSASWYAAWKLKYFLALLIGYTQQASDAQQASFLDSSENPCGSIEPRYEKKLVHRP